MTKKVNAGCLTIMTKDLKKLKQITKIHIQIK